MEQQYGEKLNHLVAEIEQHLASYVQVTPETKWQHRVVDAMAYSLEAGGKRIRPVLVLEFCHLCGGNTEKAMAAACALEMVHTFSLIHDDLPEMDDDDSRRGKPSCHKQFDHATALQAGDALLTRAFEVLCTASATPPETTLRLLQILTHATGAAGMVGGQILDMAYETRQDVTLEEQERMCACKTGALIRAACELGCVAAGGTEEKQRLAASYGEKLGLAFQIVDDILDVTSTTDVLGKPVGSDAEEHKATFVTLLGLEQAQKTAAALTAEAKELLKQFPDSGFLLALTEELLNRKK
jgi:geranylgeranyl diphosphate synthase type II